MPVTVVVGTQWGDEGKGRCVDALASRADAVVRYQGGNNAGHTLVVRGKKTVLHLVPSGALYPDVDCYLTRGVVLHPATLLKEIDALREEDVDLDGRLFISAKAPVVMPWHLEIDAARESRDGSIGTTKKGIGPCYEQFVARQAILAGDLVEPQRAIEKIELFYDERLAALKAVAGPDAENQESFASRDEAIRRFKKNHDEVYSRILPYITDVETALRGRIRRGDSIVMEGAQGTFLDIGAGTYPFVTSSHTTAAGACTGAGIAPRDIDGVIGICKAYTTRVGDGPFPTEVPLDSGVGKHLQDVGKEYGATTGRPRRCGWLDLNLLRESIEINGCDTIVLTKLDVLTGAGEIKVALGYDDEGNPAYQTFAGWTEDLTEAREPSDLPENARTYVRFIDETIKDLSSRIAQVSVGPGRAQIITL